MEQIHGMYRVGRDTFVNFILKSIESVQLIFYVQLFKNSSLQL